MSEQTKTPEAPLVGPTTETPPRPAPKPAAPPAPKPQEKRGRGRPKKPTAPPAKPIASPAEGADPILGSAAPPEFKAVKDPAELTNVHAAVERYHADQLRAWEYECRLREELNKRHGHHLPPPPRPVSLLDPHVAEGKGCNPEFAQDLVDMACSIAAAAGMESQPTDPAKRQLAESIVRVSRWYPAFESKMMDHAMVAIAGFGLAGPWIAEKRHKAAGTWESTGRPKAMEKGWIAPSDRGIKA